VSRIIDEHREYLADRHRLDAYRRALASVVRPGDVVADLAAGTGILGLLACEAGAARVYSVDEGPIIGLARQIAAESPYADRVAHVRGVVAWTELPERVDVIVSDQIGHFGFEAGVFELMPDARRRMLKPDGRVVPARLTLWMAPVEHAEARAWVDFWRTPVAGVRLTSVLAAAASTGYPLSASSDSLLAPGQPLATSHFLESALEGEAAFDVARAGRFDGMLGWFSAELAPGVTMTNGPGDPRRINRRQVYFPVDPLDVDVGDTVTSRMKILPRSMIVEWYTTVRGRHGRDRASGRHSTFGGLLVSAEDLRRTANEARPRLSRVGAARLDVLSRCTGQQTIREIEHAVAAGFPELFDNADEAARFVAEVVAVYAR
jgi:protein arginine N-methyltransferase 1